MTNYCTETGSCSLLRGIGRQEALSRCEDNPSLGVGISNGGTVGGVSICVDDSGTVELDAEAPGTYACGTSDPLLSTFG